MVTCTTPPFRAAVRLNSGVSAQMKAFRFVSFIAVALAASCSTQNEMTIIESPTSAAMEMPKPEASIANAKEIGLTLGSTYSSAEEHLLSSGWSIKNRCIEFSIGDPCVVELQRNSELTWLFLNGTSSQPTVVGVRLMECFDCER